jgi:WD40 repeat protein
MENMRARYTAIVCFALASWIPSGLVLAQSESTPDVIRLLPLPNQSEPPVVTAISIASDGLTLAAAGDDHAIRLVSLASSETIATLSEHLDWVQSLEFSPSGKRLASCGNDGVIHLWELDYSAKKVTAKLIASQTANHALLALVFRGDDEIYTAGFGGNIYRWSLQTNKFIVEHECECRDIRAIACSPDESTIAYGGRDGVLRVRQIAPAGKFASFTNSNTSTEDSSALRKSSLSGQHHNDYVAPLHYDRLRSLQFSKDGTTITSVGEDRRIVHFDLASRTTIRQASIGGGKLMGLCQLTPDLFAIAGSDNSIRIFSDREQKVLVKLIGHDGSVSVLKKTDSKIISGSFDTTIRVWDISRAVSNQSATGKYMHPVAAQFEDSGAGDAIK